MTAREFLIALVALAVAAGLFYAKARHDGAAAERPKTESALDHAATATLETQGAREAASWAAAAASQREAASATLSTLEAAAAAAGDAHAPLDPDRANRLRAADRGLCDARPELAGCSAAN